MSPHPDKSLPIPHPPLPATRYSPTTHHPPPTTRLLLGIDIGGTFTDLVLLDGVSGQAVFAKTLTTYPDPVEGILKGVEEILAKSGAAPEAIQGIVHGTTLVTNAVIERKGAKTGLLTTAGFEDVLEIGRELRYDIYDLFIDVPEPLVPRPRRKGVAERLDCRGEVLAPLDESSLAAALDDLMGQGIESLAVCLLHSFANPAHEAQIARYARERCPGLYLSLSTEIMPEIREYERSSATAMNAYVQPIIDDYLRRLEGLLRERGLGGNIQIMVSNGMLTTIAGARQAPVQLLESGPAGGAMGSVFFGKMTHSPHLLAFDMGGTTAKACVINDFQPEVTNQFEAARVRRFKKGSGLPVRIPVIDLIEIGAGGGSIARLNALGLVAVGPDSAASDPGPACYGLGGTLPTVTDADLVLGYLDENYFLGGAMPLHRSKAEAAIHDHIAAPLGIAVAEAAMGIHRIVNENMANAARVHLIEKGLDPRRYEMIAFGGAGPVHAFNVARLLRITRLIIPVGAGVTSALGFLVSPVASQQMTSYLAPLEGLDWEKTNAFLREMEDKGRAFLQQAGIDPSQAIITRQVEMRYRGQGHEITVPFPNGELSDACRPAIAAAFAREYRFRYGRTVEGMPLETVTWRTTVSGPRPEVPLQRQEADGAPAALKGYRPAYFPEGKAAVDCPVYARYALQPGQFFDGPAIIEEQESTIVVGPGSRFEMDAFGNIIIELFYA